MEELCLTTVIVAKENQENQNEDFDKLMLPRNKINILEEYVKPAVAADGREILFSTL
jgi:hypothetical protein